MFRALHTLAQAATLHLLVVAEGDLLRVTVQPKPTGKDAPVPAALSLVATPEEFDAGFVDALTTWRAPTATLIEQASAAAALPAAAPETMLSGKRNPAKPAPKRPAKKAAKPTAKPATRASVPAPAASPAPAAIEPAAPAAAADRAAEAAAHQPTPPAPGSEPAADPTPPEARIEPAPPEPAAAPATDPTPAEAPRASRRTRRTDAGPAPTVEQDRATCIAEMRAYLAGNAASEPRVKPSRADYLNKFSPASGRRYERLFGSFDELVAAAQQQALPGVGVPAPEAGTPQLGEAARLEKLAVALNPQPAWPMVPTTDSGAPAATLNAAVAASTTAPVPAPGFGPAAPPAPAPDLYIEGAGIVLADVDLPGTTTPEQAASHPHGHRAQLQRALDDRQPPADAAASPPADGRGFTLDLI